MSRFEPIETEWFPISVILVLSTGNLSIALYPRLVTSMGEVTTPLNNMKSSLPIMSEEIYSEDDGMKWMDRVVNGCLVVVPLGISILAYVHLVLN